MGRKDDQGVGIVMDFLAFLDKNRKSGGNVVRASDCNRMAHGKNGIWLMPVGSHATDPFAKQDAVINMY